MANLSSSISQITCFLYAILFLASPCYSLQKSSHTHNVKVTSLLPSNVCSRSSKGEKSIEIVHKHGPCNKRSKTEEALPSNYYQKLLQLDQIRVNSIHAQFSNRSRRNNNSGQFYEMQTELPLQSGIALGSGDYLVTVALGTPETDFQLLFDTGSDITWTQCEPCVVSCHEQAQPKFDPRKSSSYTNVSCSSPSCKLLRVSGCSSSTCLYQVKYGDRSYTVGFFATEKLTVARTDVFENFLFGCGQNNVDPLGRKIAGLIGFGRSKTSFVSQTAAKYGNIFSYCLPPSSSSTGYLRLGGGEIGNTVKFTPFSPALESSPFYGIDIIGISVDGQKLAVDNSVYTMAGTIIDSGTVVSRLQPTVYSALSAKIKESMKDYPAVTNPGSKYDTCYDLSGFETINVPKISFLLNGGVEVDIHETGIFFPVEGVKKVCLAFLPNAKDDEIAIFGNAQQKTYEIVHDLANGRLGFAPAACS